VPVLQLLPGAMGLDFPGGASVKADRRGRVTVSDEQAAAVRASTATRRYDAIIQIAPMRGHSSTGDFACDCGFVPWSWQLNGECPRCGVTLVQKET
jgi:hypothetical protein